MMVNDTLNINEMDSLNIFFQDLYRNFNERKIELVIEKITDNVKWANGIDGGYVYGHDGVNEYWTRQFTIVSSNVIPLNISIDKGVVKIKVHQVVHDLNGKLLTDEFVVHFFKMEDDKIAGFEIGEKELWRVDNLSSEEQQNYQKHIENLHYGASMAWTMKVDAEDKIRKDEKIKLAKGLKIKGIDISAIIELTGLSKDEIDQIQLSAAHNN